MPLSRTMTELADAFRQVARNERWGTCAACPQTSVHEVFPEFCEHSERYDHQRSVEELFEAYKRIRTINGRPS